MHNPFISYIIPCYNVAPFLRQCVESILSQTYSSFEIILVDDGSKDDTPALCDQLALSDSRIQVIHQPNQGLGGARNTGLHQAKGDYIIYLDSDDFWTDNNALQTLISHLSSNIDVLGFNCSYYYPQSNTYAPWSPFDSTLSTPMPFQTAFPVLSAQGITPMSACLKLIRRQWLIQNELFFHTGILAEDIPWLIHMIDCNPTICFINIYIYAYRQNTTTSITRHSTTNSFNHLLSILNSEYILIPSRHLTPQAHDAVMSFLAYEFCILLALVWDTNNKYINIQELHKLVHLLHYTQNPKVRLSAILYHIVGLRVTCRMLNLYYHYKLQKK